METIVIALLVVGALAYAVVSIRREVRPSAGGGCACDCPQADQCAGTSCPVVENSLPRPPESRRPPAARAESGEHRAKSGERRAKGGERRAKARNSSSPTLDT